MGRASRVAETCSFTNDLHDALLGKSGQDFWKMWKSKFSSNSADIVQVDGTADSAAICANFANYFESNCTTFIGSRNDQLKA